MKPIGTTLRILLASSILFLATTKADDVITAPRGEFSVGFRVIKQYDYTREFKRKHDAITGEETRGERARPIQTLIWYPAAPANAPVRYEDYVKTRFTETDFSRNSEQLAAELAKVEEKLNRRLTNGATPLLKQPMLANWDAPPLTGRFPIVIYAAGAGGSADENADMLEHLASHGYVVVASTSLGAYDKEIRYDMTSVEPQVADIRFLLAYASKLDNVDPQNMAVLGWSWGGMTNLFAASRDERIAAVISLDGTREPEFTKQIDIQRLTAPWLYVSRTPDTIPQINRSEIDTRFSLLNEAKYTDVYQLIMYPMQHIDFISQRLRESSPQSYKEYSREELIEAYTTVTNHVRHFLDAYLKNEQRARDFLARSPRENGATPHSARLERAPAEAVPSTQLQMAKTLSSMGFSHAIRIYQEAVAHDPKFSLDAEALQAWGYALMARKRPADAAHIFLLWTTRFPQDANAFSSLGEAYEADGKKPLAIDSYRQALKLDSNNKNAATRLKALGGSVPKQS